MANAKPVFDTQKFTLTLIISFVVVVVFSMLMMLWHGSYEKDAQGNTHYNTRVNEPSTSY
ncbi:MAG: hypothetical protein JO072_10765 [Parafilimonas sp.]|nr:hypothetical protein [Parafilimonas sp.]